MIMTSHILLPQIDPAEPVTLSSSFNQELLRDRLGYRGVIVSDDIGMHAVSRMFEDPTAPVRFLRSGADMMMVCRLAPVTDAGERIVAAERCVIIEFRPALHDRDTSRFESLPRPEAFEVLPAARSLMQLHPLLEDYGRIGIDLRLVAHAFHLDRNAGDNSSPKEHQSRN